MFANSNSSAFPGIYWGIVTSIYLAWSFSVDAWGISWIIWPVTGVLFVAIYGIVKAVMKEKIKNTCKGQEDLI